MDAFEKARGPGAILFVFIYVTALYILPVQFGENDDAVMMALASGQYSGTPSAYLVFINYYLGAVLAQLYQWMPDLHWYPVFFAAMQVLSVLVITDHILFRSQATPLHRLVLAGLVLALALLLLVRIQFTTTAALTLMAGVLLMLRSDMKAWILGGVMIVLAFMLRFEAAALALLIFAPFVAFHTLHSPQRVGRLTALVLVGVAALGAHLASDRAYHAAGANYFEYNEVRGRLNDNPNAKDPAVQIPGGLERNDFDLLRAFFPDGQVIDLDSARQLLTAVEEIEQQTFPFHPGKVKYMILNHPYGMSGALIALLGLLMLRTRANQLVLLASLGLMLCCFAYVTNLAVLKDRVIITGLLPIFVMIALMGPFRDQRLGRGLLYVAALGGALVFTYGAFRKTQQNIARHEIFAQQLEMITATDRRIVAYGADFRPQGNMLFGGFRALAPGKIAYAGWMVNHPENLATSSHDMLVSDQVALIIKTKGMEENLNRITQSLRTNYGLETTPVILDEMPDFALVGFVPAS